VPFIGHLPEVFIILVIALLVFGPKRMIEMGSSLGKAFRELRESTRDIPGLGRFTSLNGLLDDDEPRHTPFATMSQVAQNATIEAEPDHSTAAPSQSGTVPASAAATNGAAPVVESVVEHTHIEERPRE
jgi:sec-independent protein translocase protein TatA